MSPDVDLCPAHGGACGWLITVSFSLYTRSAMCLFLLPRPYLSLHDEDPTVSDACAAASASQCSRLDNISLTIVVWYFIECT